jgi:hypothetical protein
VVIVGGPWLRGPREAQVRKDMRARPVVDFRASVGVKVNVFGMMLAARGPLHLIVRGDAFEVAHPFPPARFVFGQDYFYRADDVTVEAVPGLRHDWIEIDGEQAARIWIGQRNLNR